MKEPSGMIKETYLTSRKICEVVMNTAEPVYTWEANDRVVNILDIIYNKVEL